MRLIDLDSEYIQETLYRRDFKTRQDIEKWLNNAPIIDAVPVVRCKDCKKSELVPDFDGLYSCRGKRQHQSVSCLSSSPARRFHASIASFSCLHFLV